MAYAEKTSVSVVKTKADIEELIQKAGAEQIHILSRQQMQIIHRAAAGGGIGVAGAESSCR